jgi:hypothetical protein
VPLSVRARRAIGCAGGAALAALVLLGLAYWWLASPDREEYARYSFPPDVEVRLFIESDFDHAPSLYYEIRKGRRLAVRATYLGPAPEKPLDFRTASSPDGSIDAVWAPGEITILYHRPSGESWPRLRDDETSDMPAVRANWRARFDLIRQTGIPVPPELIPAPATTQSPPTAAPSPAAPTPRASGP